MTSYFFSSFPPQKAALLRFWQRCWFRSLEFAESPGNVGFEGCNKGIQNERWYQADRVKACHFSA